MRSNTRALCVLAVALMGQASAVQAQEQPLSVIDWLARNPDQPAMTSANVPTGLEPPVSLNALAPEVTVMQLEEQAPRLIGLVPSTVTGLPASLWAGSTSEGLAAQLENLPLFQLPAAQALLFTLLLNEATGPASEKGGEEMLTLARVDTLMRFGAPEPALALLDQAGVTRSAAHFQRYMDAALLTGSEDAGCAILAANTHLAPTLAHRIFCAARLGDWPTAALLFDTGSMLGELAVPQSRALERFLHPDGFEDLPRLARPEPMSPLLFRIHEAIGEPLPTRNLPRAYAVADLRDLLGWKTQLEAAERLAAAGALPANRLLGLYTARQPAASGGVWDRVTAVQRLETALRARSEEAITKTLPPAWSAMRQAGLEIIFSDLFAVALERYQLSGNAARIAETMVLLSPEYRRVPLRATETTLAHAVAEGDVQGAFGATARETAIISGFDRSNARSDLLDMARNGRMGEAVLRALVLLEEGAAGDPVSLTQALATLRSLGLEDTVRRAALQILLLERYR